MHANFQELLSVRDGEPVAAETVQHVAACSECGFELARLRRLAQDLNRLAPFEAPQRSWSNIRERLRSLRDDPKQSRSRRLSAAVAASIVITLAIVLSSVRNHRNGSEPVGSDASAQTHPGPEVQSISQLVTRCQQLEAMLQSLPQRPTVQRAETSATIDELQTGIQMLDLQLSNVTRNDPDHKQARRLWSTRVELLDSLVYVRYAEAAHDGYSPINAMDSGAI
jgi:hypothetical protein